MISCTSQHPLALSVEVFCADFVATCRIAMGKTVHTCSLKRETIVGHKKLSMESCDPKAKTCSQTMRTSLLWRTFPHRLSSLLAKSNVVWWLWWCEVAAFASVLTGNPSPSTPALCYRTPLMAVLCFFVECLKPTSEWFLYFCLRKLLSSDLPRVSCKISCAHSPSFVCVMQQFFLQLCDTCASTRTVQLHCNAGQRIHFWSMF